MRSQGVSHKGYTSKPPVREEREVNRLHGEAMKKKKDAAEEAAARKRKRKENHKKECKIARAEGKPWPATPESTNEEGRTPRTPSSSRTMTRRRQARVPRRSIKGLATGMCQ